MSIVHTTGDTRTSGLAAAILYFWCWSTSAKVDVEFTGLGDHENISIVIGISCLSFKREIEGASGLAVIFKYGNKLHFRCDKYLVTDKFLRKMHQTASKSVPLRRYRIKFLGVILLPPPSCRHTLPKNCCRMRVNDVPRRCCIYIISD